MLVRHFGMAAEDADPTDPFGSHGQVLRSLSVSAGGSDRLRFASREGSTAGRECSYRVEGALRSRVLPSPGCERVPGPSTHARRGRDAGVRPARDRLQRRSWDCGQHNQRPAYNSKAARRGGELRGSGRWPREALQQGCESGSREPGTFVLLALHDGRCSARVTATTDQPSAAKR